ncbi:MAG: hypothetical protein H7Y20_02090, partial [Bryobacteraceae bacterium]|nr:hypothetical protein [Bryobacteraceae bacterium]
MTTGNLLFSAACGALAISTLLAQDVIQLRVPPPEPGDPTGPHTVVFDSNVTPPPPGANTRVSAFEFVRSEFGSNEAVKGAPYTADATTETVQTLADGNRIVHTDTTTIARDTEGRTRRDIKMPAFAAPGASE